MRHAVVLSINAVLGNANVARLVQAWALLFVVCRGLIGSISDCFGREEVDLQRMVAQARNSNRKKQGAFTLVEIMITVAVIGLLAAIAIPNFMKYRKIAQGVKTANDMRVFGDGFAIYSFEKGQYPPDSHEELPDAPEIEEYVNETMFNSPSPIGGKYNWEGPERYPYAGVSVSGGSLSDEDLLTVDKAVDDGDLNSGHYRKTGNGRYTYIVEES